MQDINKIISESIRRVIGEGYTNEGKSSDSKSKKSSKKIIDLLKKFNDKPNENSGKGKKKNLKRKRISGNRFITFDLDEYKKDNTPVSNGEAKSIADSIDMDLLDLAAVARRVFPSHTDAGAQSQLRKILNGERPMTGKVAHKLNLMISAGEIPVN